MQGIKGKRCAHTNHKAQRPLPLSRLVPPESASRVLSPTVQALAAGWLARWAVCVCVCGVVCTGVNGVVAARGGHRYTVLLNASSSTCRQGRDRPS